MNNTRNSLLCSVLAHAVLVCFLLVLVIRAPVSLIAGKTTEKFAEKSIDVQFIKKKAIAIAQAPLEPKKSSRHTVNKISPIPALDLRPDYMKHSISSAGGVALPGKKIADQKPSETSGNSAHEILTIAPRVSTAFDHLAATINRNLDYPTLLFEHNVQGTAILDLRFDSEGKISESESQFSGSHLAVRGLLAHAARLAIVEWYQSDAYRLKKEEFKGQHFRAEFEITYTEENARELSKEGPGSYQMLRRRKKNECAHPLGVDVGCVVAKAAGAIDDLFTDSSRIHFRLLMEKIDHYDDQGLHGINETIAGT